jgi:tripartite-type tricarboxylate transporter receptor subunit TctC
MMIFAASVTVFVPPATLAQPFPSKLVRIVVNTPPGSPIDPIARLTADQLRERLGQPFIVENRPGAGGSIGSDSVANSPADGYTLLLTNDAPLTVNPSVYAKFPVDPLKSLAPVAMLGDGGASVLVVSANLPVRSLAEFVEYARTRAGALNYASGGHGTPSNILAEIFIRQAQLDLQHVPLSRGLATAAAEVSAQRVAMYISPPGLLVGHIRSGTLRALATAGAKRSALLPEVPTFAETGYPAYVPPSWWFAVFAPTGTPAEVIELLNSEIRRIVAMPRMREALAAQGVEPGALSPAEVGDRLRRDTGYWSGVVRTLGIRAE